MTSGTADSLNNQNSNPSPLIYIIESDATQAELLKQTLIDNGCRVQIFTEIDTFFQNVSTDSNAELPSAVVMSLIFSGDDISTSSLNGLEVCKKTQIPVFVISEREDLSARLAALRSGAQHYLSKPVDTSHLMGLINELNGLQKLEPYRVLLIEDDKTSIESNGRILNKAGMLVHILLEPLQTLEVIKEFNPDVIVLDVSMSDINGAEMVTVLHDSGFRLPVLFLSGDTDLTQQLLSLENGGDDFMVKPVKPNHLVTTVTAHAKRSRRGNAISYRLKNTLYEREHLALDHHSIVSATDKLGNITYVNDHFCEVSGYSRDELLGRNHRIIKSGKHAPEFYQEMWNTIIQGDVWHGETCNKRKDGSLFWVESTITPFLDSKGEPYQYVAIRTDISQLKESEQTLHAIVNGTSLVTGEAFFHSSVQCLAESMNVRFGFIAKKDIEEASTIKTIAIWDTDHIIDNFSYPVKDTPCEQVLSTGLSVYSDLVAESFPKDLWLKENDIESYIGIALFGSNGNSLGHMGVIDDKPMSNTDTKINLLRIFAASVAGEMEREQSQAALQASESRLNFLVSSSPVTIYTSEAIPPYAATYISPNIKQLMGYEPEQFTNNSNFWAENIHPDDQQEVFDLLPQLFEHGTHCHEYRYLKQDGSYSWMRDELRLITDESGEPVEIVGYWADINDRILTEQALKLNKERLRRGQAFANIGTWDWNVKTGELYWSERIAPLFGYADGELETSYENFINAVHPDDRQLVSDAVTACVEQDIAYDIEHRVLWPDGTIRWLQERGAVTRDAEGQPLHMLGVVQDIHVRKEAELSLHEREYQLREAQTLARIGNWKADLLTGDLIWSDEIYRIFGFEPGAFEPSIDIFNSALHPDDRSKVQESEKRAGQTGHHDVIHRIVRPDGSIRHVHELAQAVTDSSGQLIELAGTVQDVTEQVEYESRIKHSEQRFAFAVEGAGDGIWDWNMKTSVMQFSRLYMEMLGYAENELPQHVDTWVGSVHPDDLARIQENLQEYLQGQTPTYHVELRLRCKDSSYKWILCRGTIVDRDEEGNAIRMIGIHSDITKQKLANVALNRFKTTLDMTKDCVFMFEPASLKFFYVNQGSIEQFGYSEIELMNMTPIDIKPYYDETQFRQAIKPLIVGEIDSLTFETFHQHKNGSKIPVEISLQYIEPEGESARFVAIVRNITDRKKIEEAIKESQQRMALHVQRTPLGVIEWDNNFCVSEWNNAAESIFKYSKEEVVGQHATDIIIPDNLFNQVGEVWEELLTLKGGLRSSNENITKDGNMIFCEWYNTPLINDEGKVIGVASLVQDITKQKNAEINLIRAKVEAEYANNAKSEFLSNMSHELRTPMNAILGFGQLLEFDDDMTDLQNDNVQEILTAGHHLLSLINEVLDLAKVESGQIELSLEPVDVYQVVQECFNLIEPLALKRDIRISHSGLKGVAVRADHTRFKQVLINILSNAIKYNHEGGTVRVKVEHIDNDRLKIIITDTGIGVPEEDLADVFQPFNRLNAEKSNIEGTGIGLTITRRIVELMGGTINVESEVGVGSSFWIELPLETIAESDYVELIDNSDASQQIDSTIKYTVLYIEDNPANLKLVAQILGRRKHIHLLTAHTPEIGIELARNRLPELILLDINMPNMDGYEVMKIFNTDNSLKNIPVVAVTANAMSRDIERGKVAGFSDYVTKPIDVTNFLAVIDQYLSQKKTTY